MVKKSAKQHLAEFQNSIKQLQTEIKILPRPHHSKSYLHLLLIWKKSSRTAGQVQSSSRDFPKCFRLIRTSQEFICCNYRDSKNFTKSRSIGTRKTQSRNFHQSWNQKISARSHNNKPYLTSLGDLEQPLGNLQGNLGGVDATSQEVFQTVSDLQKRIRDISK